MAAPRAPEDISDSALRGSGPCDRTDSGPCGTLVPVGLWYLCFRLVFGMRVWASAAIACPHRGERPRGSIPSVLVASGDILMPLHIILFYCSAIVLPKADLLLLTGRRRKTFLLRRH